MNRSIFAATAMAVVCLTSTQPAVSQTARDIQGVWKVVETVVPAGPQKGTHTSDVQPSLYIFTKSHYSILAINAYKPRPALTGAPSSVEEYAAIYGQFNANAGIYELKEESIIFTPVVAASPAVMSVGSIRPFHMEWQDKDLWLVISSPVGDSRTRLTRVSD